MEEEDTTRSTLQCDYSTMPFCILSKRMGNKGAGYMTLGFYQSFLWPEDLEEWDGVGLETVGRCKDFWD